MSIDHIIRHYNFKVVFFFPIFRALVLFGVVCIGEVGKYVNKYFRNRAQKPYFRALYTIYILYLDGKNFSLVKSGLIEIKAKEL